MDAKYEIIESPQNFLRTEVGGTYLFAGRGTIQVSQDRVVTYEMFSNESDKEKYIYVTFENVPPRQWLKTPYKWDYIGAIHGNVVNEIENRIRSDLEK